MISLSGKNGRYYNNFKSTLLVYDTSGCSSQGVSWSPSNGCLNKSKQASTQLIYNHIISHESVSIPGFAFLV